MYFLSLLCPFWKIYDSWISSIIRLLYMLSLITHVIDRWLLIRHHLRLNHHRLSYHWLHIRCWVHRSLYHSIWSLIVICNNNGLFSAHIIILNINMGTTMIHIIRHMLCNISNYTSFLTTPTNYSYDDNDGNNRTYTSTNWWSWAWALAAWAWTWAVTAIT